MVMRIVVVGGGVVGVTTAWYLARDGHEVTVVDRAADVALETSYANGGQISVSHAEPWANPAAPARIFRWLGQEASPLLWRFTADPAQWAWGWQFLRECAAVRTRANMHALIGLGLHSREQLRRLRSQLQLNYDHLSRGILHIYSEQSEFDRARRQAEVMREFGCERHPVSDDECIQIEPALAGASVPIQGGTYTADDESGDALAFSRVLALNAQNSGARFRFNTHVEAIHCQGEQVAHLRMANGDVLTADHFVIACGSYSPLLLRPIGIQLPIYPAKGYSVSFSLKEGTVAPTVSLTDDEYKLVFSRLGSRLRVAGTAEFTGYDTTINAIRCQAIAARATQWFPDLAQMDAPVYWAGLRPSTPGNLPLIGKASMNNLWINSGHGTLGWTLACGSANLLADLMVGRTPAVDPAPYSIK
jgi:D-amino-acid dehydrogenase